MTADNVIVVLVTAPPDRAAAIASHLVENRLVACVNIVPAVRSIYRWQGKIEDDSECLLVMKTVRERFDELRTAVRQVHPYTVPEIIALPVVDGFDGYLTWVRDSVGP